MPPTRFLAAALCAAALCLAGCSRDGAQDRLADYLQRLSRALGTDIQPGELRSIPAPPRWTSLQIPLEGGSIDGLDFLRLRGCALQETVARRNSSLGRVAPPSQRLLLELEFLDRVEPCIHFQREQGENALAELLTESAALKKVQLPALIFNATLGGEEYRNFWRSTDLSADYPSNTSSLVTTALENITANATRWLAGDYTADGRAFELDLSDVARGDGGELLAALSLQAAYLDAGSAALHAQAERGPLCRPQLRPARANILRNVATRYFVGEIQPWSAALGRRAHALLPPLQTLEVQLAPTLPAALSDWRKERNTAIDRRTGAPRRHVSALQTLLGSCFSEFSPG